MLPILEHLLFPISIIYFYFNYVFPKNIFHINCLNVGDRKLYSQYWCTNKLELRKYKRDVEVRRPRRTRCKHQLAMNRWTIRISWADIATGFLAGFHGLLRDHPSSLDLENIFFQLANQRACWIWIVVKCEFSTNQSQSKKLNFYTISHYVLITHKC